MKIIHIGWGFDDIISGGLDIHVTRLTGSQSRKGHDIHLFLPKMNAPESTPHITIHPIEATEKDPTEEMISAYNKSIISASKDIAADIVHSHDWLGKEAAEQISKEKNIPWIHTVHSLEYMRSARETPKESGIETIEKDAVERCHMIITVSDLMKNEILRHYQIPKEKIAVIPNYTSCLPKTAKKTSHPYPTILTVSRLSTQKGLEHLIYASPAIIEAFPDARFIIAGKGHMEEPLKEFTRILNVENAFKFTGFLTNDDLAGYYSSCDLFMIPSVWEPFGITLLDAADFGIPILASETTGAAELFKETVTTHKPSSSKDIKEKAIMLLKDRQHAKSLAEKAKQRLETLDNWDSITEKTIKLYESVRL